jgi:hypothetical protein
LFSSIASEGGEFRLREIRVPSEGLKANAYGTGRDVQLERGRNELPMLGDIS